VPYALQRLADSCYIILSYNDIATLSLDSINRTHQIELDNNLLSNLLPDSIRQYLYSLNDEWDLKQNGNTKTHDSLLIAQFLLDNKITATPGNFTVSYTRNVAVEMVLNDIEKDTLLFSASLDSLRRLFRIYAGKCGIRLVQCPEKFRYPKFIDLSSNRIDSLPELFIDNLCDKSFLDLKYNELHTLPLSIMQKKLYITIDYNHLVNIPDTLAQWLDKQDSDWRKTQKP
jgi:hypothetical protein